MGNRHPLVLLMASLLAGCCAASFAQTAAPTTQAASSPTPEQKAVINAYANHDPSVPIIRLDIAYILDGAPNRNFGKTNQRWAKMHESFMKRKEKPIDVLFLGDSITEGWSGKGRQIWEERYAKLNAANFGISGDRTQHVLWRIDNGELDGITPKVVVLMIGTNNAGVAAEKITAGVKAIVARIHQKLPESKLLLLGIFPRGANPTKDGNPDPVRAKLQSVNAELAKLDDGNKTRYMEIWKQFLNDDGTMSKEIMPDFLHPDEKGYQIWADAMQPLLDEMLKAP